MSKIDLIIERIKVAPPEVVDEVYALMEKLDADERPPNEGIGKYFGLLKGLPVFEGDPVEIQRKMRAEWDRE